jgi:hypothetical protein
MNAWQELDRRCAAKNKAGQRCGRAPIAGGTTCILHGSGTEAAKRAAQMRLLAMVEPVLGTFEAILARYEARRCPTCGLPDGNPLPVIKVGQLVLDRAGFAPKIELALQSANDLSHLSLDELIATLEEMLADAIATRDLERRLSDTLAEEKRLQLLLTDGSVIDIT